MLLKQPDTSTTLEDPQAGMWLSDVLADLSLALIFVVLKARQRAKLRLLLGLTEKAFELMEQEKKVCTRAVLIMNGYHSKRRVVVGARRCGVFGVP